MPAGDERRSAVARRLIAAALAVTALSLASCGSDGQEGTGARNGRAETSIESRAQNAAAREEYRERGAVEAPTEDEAAGEDVASRFYAILAADDGDADRTTIDSGSFCGLMSEEARAQTIRYAKVSSGLPQSWSCESAVDLLVLRSKRTGGFEGVREAEVIGVNVEGDRATASVRFGDGPIASLPLIRENDRWKLAATPASGSLEL